MKILILGASGRTGKLVLKEALDQGYSVNCIVRNPSKLKIAHPNLTLIEGTPADSEILAIGMQGCEALVSALNVSRNSDFPWSGLRTPEYFLSDVMTKVLNSSNESGLKRIVICSAWGTSETKEDLPGWFAWFIDNSNIGVAYRDHERQEELIRNSDLDWTVVRPSGLMNGKKQQKVIVSYNNQPKPKLTINRLSVAKFMINALIDDELIGKMPTISA